MMDSTQGGGDDMSERNDTKFNTASDGPEIRYAGVGEAAGFFRLRPFRKDWTPRARRETTETERGRVHQY